MSGVLVFRLSLVISKSGYLGYSLTSVSGLQLPHWSNGDRGTNSHVHVFMCSKEGENQNVLYEVRGAIAS